MYILLSIYENIFASHWHSYYDFQNIFLIYRWWLENVLNPISRNFVTVSRSTLLCLVWHCDVTLGILWNAPEFLVFRRKSWWMYDMQQSMINYLTLIIELMSKIYKKKIKIRKNRNQNFSRTFLIFITLSTNTITLHSRS